MQQGKTSKHKKRSPFIRIDIIQKFTLTLRKQELDQLISTAVEDGIGDWGIIIAVTGLNKSRPYRPLYTLPIEVLDITTNKRHIVTKSKILRAIRDTLIDFPYALNTNAGYNLSIGKLTRENIDEIIQVAIFRKIKYKFV